MATFKIVYKDGKVVIEKANNITELENKYDLNNKQIKNVYFVLNKYK